jgi:hypothetical protein
LKNNMSESSIKINNNRTLGVSVAMGMLGMKKSSRPHHFRSG